MPTLLDYSVTERGWRTEVTKRARSSVSGPSPANGSVSAPQSARAERWRAVIDQLAAMQHLGNNWDGLGAAAPTSEMLACAIGLASILLEQSVDPPTRIVPGTDGTILFEWQFSDGAYGEVELVRPFFGEVMLLSPGKPAQHWTIPNA